MPVYIDYAQINALAEELNSAINKEKGKRPTNFFLIEVSREREADGEYLAVQPITLTMPSEIFYLIERSNAGRYHYLRLRASSKERNVRLLKIIETEIAVIDMWIKCWFDREFSAHPKLQRLRKHLFKQGYRPFFKGNQVVLAETKNR